MKLQYCSDLHLEFPENKCFLKENPLHPSGDILILAGDIVPFSIMKKQNDFFDFISDNFELVYWLPGNHEYYHSDAARRSGIFHEKIRSNVFLVNNLSVQHDGVKLIFSTLWSKISPANESCIRRTMNDFRLIKFNGATFSPSDFNQMHADSLSFIKNELNKEYTGKTVVVSHHVPTFLHYPQKYKGDRLSEAFAVELFDFIEGSAIDYWIYGHHHANVPDFLIGKTQIVTNQLGYVRAKEHSFFNPNKTLTPSSNSLPDSPVLL